MYNSTVVQSPVTMCSQAGLYNSDTIHAKPGHKAAGMRGTYGVMQMTLRK